MLGLAGLVGALLAVFGVGAVLLPPSFGDSSSSSGAAPAEPTPTGVAVFGSLAPAADRRPAPTPTTPPVPKKTAKPTPAPGATPSPATPPRTTTRSGAGNGANAAVQGPQAQVVTLVNAERKQAGCDPVAVDARLTAAAQAHSQDQADHDSMSHTGSDGSTPWDRARAAGYDQAIGENVAAGYRTPEAVMDGWMNSEGHRANILNCTARAIGVGRAAAAAADGTLYWTQLFGAV